MVDRFYWVVDGLLAGASRPGSGRGISANLRAAAQRTDLVDLRERGIRAVLTLTETALDADAIAAANLTVLHLPIEDMEAPAPAQFLQALEFIDVRIASGDPVAVHCLAGQGRTGTILAAYLIRQGATADEAIAMIRARCPGAIESPPQTAALRRFAEDRAWIL